VAVEVLAEIVSENGLTFPRYQLKLATREHSEARAVYRGDVQHHHTYKLLVASVSPGSQGIDP
jgi:hypothetical protein